MNSGPVRRSIRVSALSGTIWLVRVPDIKLPEVVEICPVLPFSLCVDLPIPSEAIEVIDKSASHEGLNGFVDVRDSHPLLQGSFEINVDINLWNMRQEGGADLGDFRSFTSRAEEQIEVVVQQIGVTA